MEEEAEKKSTYPIRDMQSRCLACSDRKTRREVSDRKPTRCMNEVQDKTPFAKRRCQAYIVPFPIGQAELEAAAGAVGIMEHELRTINGDIDRARYQLERLESDKKYADAALYRLKAEVIRLAGGVPDGPKVPVSAGDRTKETA